MCQGHTTQLSHVQDVHHETMNDRTRAGMWVLLALFVGSLGPALPSDTSPASEFACVRVYEHFHVDQLKSADTHETSNLP